MVETPWGDSSSLRNLRLSPGPGKTPDKVLENQRRRLFAAMVACAAETGYAATRIADLATIAGISTKAFYRQFPDKEACLLATIDAVLEKFGTTDPIEAVTSQPAAAKLCLLEAPAAGSEGLDRFDRLLADLEERALTAAPAASGEPRVEVGRACVGGLVEVTRSRLRQGREEELPQLIQSLRALFSSYRPPPKPLPLPARRSAPATESLEAPDRAERLIRALAMVVADRGYAQATVGEIVGRAGVSNSIFYSHFRNKEEATLAAIESGCAQIVAAVLPAFRRAGEWPGGVGAAMQALFNFLAFRPALGQLVMVTANEVGATALGRRNRALRPLLEVFGRGSLQPSEALPVWFEAMAGAVYHLAYTTLRQDGPAALPRLAPVSAYLALVPFLGPEPAAAIAAGDTDRGSPEADPWRSARSAALTHAVLTAFTRRPATVASVAAEVDAPEDDVRALVERLVRTGFVLPAGGDGQEELYQAKLGLLMEDEWDRLRPREREAISAEVIGLIEQDIATAMQSGTFDHRLSRGLTRAHLLTDEEGWSELDRLHVKMMRDVLEVQARSARRLEQSEGDQPIHVGHVAMFFEMPPPG
jgi:AcrR family transcriptional regulator